MKPKLRFKMYSVYNIETSFMRLDAPVEDIPYFIKLLWPSELKKPIIRFPLLKVGRKKSCE